MNVWAKVLLDLPALLMVLIRRVALKLLRFEPVVVVVVVVVLVRPLTVEWVARAFPGLK